jgi:AAA15 family ATPase/GTPase
MHLTKLELKKYKKVSLANINLEPINVIVGGNNAGKSSILQGIHFSVTASAASRQQGQQTFSCDYLLYNPTQDFSILRNGTPYKNFRGDNESKLTLKTNVLNNEGEIEEISYSITLYKGRNHGNIGCERTGSYIKLGALITNPSSLFSIYVPGLAGVPQVEELRAQAIVRRGVASGDANLYLRNVIYYIKKDGKLRQLNDWFSSIFNNATVTVLFNDTKDTFINVKVRVDGKTVPLELAGTGILQILQIISYVTYFNPSLLLLDEPDSHLHPNNQAVLAEVLQRNLRRNRYTNNIMYS